MKAPLIENFKNIELIIDGVKEQGITLDFEKATAFEKNVFIGLIRGRIPIEDCFFCNSYLRNQKDEKDSALYFHGFMGVEQIIPDYYNSHEESHLLFSNSNVVIVHDKHDLVTRSTVMTVTEDGLIQADAKYKGCNSLSKGYINDAGFETVIKKLITDYPERLITLKKHFDKNSKNTVDETPEYTVENIDDYQSKLTNEQESELINHCNEFKIAPVISAWYDDLDDFYDDWCNHVGSTKEEADRILHSKKYGEFKIFKDNQIVRLSL